MRKVLIIYHIFINTTSFAQDTMSKVLFTPSLGFSDAINLNHTLNQPYGLELYQQINSPSVYGNFGIEIKLNNRLYICIDVHARSLSENKFDTKMNEYYSNNNLSNISKEEKSGHQSLTGGFCSWFRYEKLIFKPKISFGVQQSYSLSHKYTIRPYISNYYTNVRITNESTPKMFFNFDFDIGHWTFQNSILLLKFWCRIWYGIK